MAIFAIAAGVEAIVAASPTSIPLMLALTLAAQMEVVRRRARAAGVTIAPSRRRPRG